MVHPEHQEHISLEEWLSERAPLWDEEGGLYPWGFVDSEKETRFRTDWKQGRFYTCRLLENSRHFRNLNTFLAMVLPSATLYIVSTSADSTSLVKCMVAFFAMVYGTMSPSWIITTACSLTVTWIPVAIQFVSLLRQQPYRYSFELWVDLLVFNLLSFFVGIAFNASLQVYRRKEWLSSLATQRCSKTGTPLGRSAAESVSSRSSLKSARSTLSRGLERTPSLDSTCLTLKYHSLDCLRFSDSANSCRSQRSLAEERVRQWLKAQQEQHVAG
eukprot:2400311-Rhodomonas_salina.1